MKQSDSNTAFDDHYRYLIRNFLDAAKQGRNERLLETDKGRYKFVTSFCHIENDFRPGRAALFEGDWRTVAREFDKLEMLVIGCHDSAERVQVFTDIRAAHDEMRGCSLVLDTRHRFGFYWSEYGPWWRLLP